MAIQIPQGYIVSAPEAIDNRLVMSKEQMRYMSRSENLGRLPLSYFCVCSDAEPDGTHLLYLFNRRTPYDPDLNGTGRYVAYSGAWVTLAGKPVAGQGIDPEKYNDRTAPSISVNIGDYLSFDSEGALVIDPELVAIINELNETLQKKQDKLIAKEGILLNNSEISVAFDDDTIILTGSGQLAVDRAQFASSEEFALLDQTVTDGFIAVNSELARLDAEKQNLLTASDGIILNNDVISVDIMDVLPGIAGKGGKALIVTSEGTLIWGEAGKVDGLDLIDGTTTRVPIENKIIKLNLGDGLDFGSEGLEVALEEVFPNMAGQNGKALMIDSEGNLSWGDAGKIDSIEVSDGTTTKVIPLANRQVTIRTDKGIGIATDGKIIHTNEIVAATIPATSIFIPKGVDAQGHITDGATGAANALREVRFLGKDSTSNTWVELESATISGQEVTKAVLKVAGYNPALVDKYRDATLKIDSTGLTVNLSGAEQKILATDTSEQFIIVNGNKLSLNPELLRRLELVDFKKNAIDSEGINDPRFYPTIQLLNEQLGLKQDELTADYPIVITSEDRIQLLYDTDTLALKPATSKLYAKDVDMAVWGNLTDLLTSQTSEGNKLADIDYVNGAIAGNLGAFRGNFDSVSQLPTKAQVPSLAKNDYAFVTTEIVTSEGVQFFYNRYKFADTPAPGHWEFEYRVSGSTFTVNQLKAINSNWTNQLTDIAIDHFNDTVIHVTSEDKVRWDGKQDTLTASKGIAIVSKDIQHTNTITAQTTKEAYKVTLDAQGHVNGTPEVYHPDWEVEDTTKSDFIEHRPAIKRDASSPALSPDRNTGVKIGNINTNVASGSYAVAAGNNASATDAAAFAEGSNTLASAIAAHAEGGVTIASGSRAHAEGSLTTASGYASHAEGGNAQATNEYAHAEGYQSIASGKYSHAEAVATQALGRGSHAEGNYTVTSEGADYSHAEGSHTKTLGIAAHAEGGDTTASGTRAHAEGSATTASGTASHAEGGGTTASGTRSHAEGYNTQALGQSSHAEGTSTIANSMASHAEGLSTQTKADGSHTEGYQTITSEGASYSHAEGRETKTVGQNSHAEGYRTRSTGINSHAEGNITVSSGDNSHAEGAGSNASGINSHAEGYKGTASGFAAHVEGGFIDGTDEFINVASGEASHAEGVDTLASGGVSHAEGSSSVASGVVSHAEGYGSTASDRASHAEGYGSTASGEASHAEGGDTVASGLRAHAEGENTVASGDRAHAEGAGTEASKVNSHAEGQGAKATGRVAHAEGIMTVASGVYSHAEGENTTASGGSSHAEGSGTTASANEDHAEGKDTTASGGSSHAEGGRTNASGTDSHAEGLRTTASGHASHAEGMDTIASGYYSHAEGSMTRASSTYQHVQGQYNVEDTTGRYVDIVGWGSSDTARKNISSLTTTGDLHIKKDFYFQSDDDGQNGYKLPYTIEKITGNGAKTLASAKRDHVYIYTGKITSLTVTAIENADAITDIIFTAGTSITVNLPTGVKKPADFTFEPNKTYEINILNNLALIGVWE